MKTEFVLSIPAIPSFDQTMRGFLAFSLFYVGRQYRIVICIPIQSLTTAAGASSHNSRPIAQILTVNQPRGIFSAGGAGIAHWGCGSGKAPQNVSGSSILPTPGRKEPFFTYLTILPRNQRHRTNKRPQKPDPRTTSSVVQSNGRARG